MLSVEIILQQRHRTMKITQLGSLFRRSQLPSDAIAKVPAVYWTSGANCEEWLDKTCNCTGLHVTALTRIDVLNKMGVMWR